MNFNFDQVHNRLNTSSYKWDQTEALYGDKEVLPMWVADMDFMSPPEVRNALMERAEHGIYGYTIKPPSYYEAIMGWIKKRHGWQIEKEWISTSPGIVTALSILVSTLTEAGDKIMIQSPVYPPFYDVVTRNGRELVINELLLSNGRYTMDFEALESQMENGVKMLILCSPHNPIGRVWEQEELQRLGEICLKHDVLVVSDEIHCDLVYRGHRHIPFASISEQLTQQTITCMAPSKTFNLAGLQISNVIIPNEEWRKRYNEKLAALSLHMENYFGTIAMEAAYLHGEPWLESLIDYLAGNLELTSDYFQKHIPQIKVIQPEGTYLVWLDCRALDLSAGELKEFFAKEAKVGLNQGIAFGKSGEGFVRLNIACPKATLQEGLERINNAVNRLFPV